MEKILQRFVEDFGNWGVTIPETDIRDKKSGMIKQFGGWIIMFIFGVENEQTYLEYYAIHRMTNDRHRRIYESGEIADLDALAAENSQEKNHEVASQLPAMFKDELQKLGELIN